ncbi:4Fe-4S ferredoxin iron-sulfur binding domain protein [Ferrimonas balearica DSM 9799]|uniref:4Fe-4S ferredoxin iron-sulfur binding domain protein n=1 Tax=Ferrimonas balearica (strain DSM 9799 / CCM 4581 / KCTC 23876 / PAT) TaxID=550540 RepID=E1SP76_FERBD|nr:4Fe-4S dicluster domain-containing protein [Ferrimonas balearica]ADN75701.1 4Fe-4S ferredoxin iron-sulfur binding domain protein [Ferrimonas balearica DSM 9799]MBW3138600.1 4Fe-4S dicluster domain-containing protein [Ferrimonas balearica]MBY5979369.1 4Fe-4S dicluster domain-containing protein [Ferrimonas balearica]MBY6019957.1 4Fe-4S dicluster domain-containing protein [Halomonas denitrificans]
MDNQLQRGFVFRQENCVGCQACTIACQIHNELPENVRFRKVDRYEVKRGDDEIDVWLTHSCMHCGNPACLMVCPAGAFTTRDDGLVVLDRERCTSCGLCVSACPYDAIAVDPRDGRAAKCNMCVELIDQGQQPACVTGCTVGCLTTDNVSQLLKSNTHASKTGVGYRDNLTKPNMVIIKERV